MNTLSKTLGSGILALSLSSCAQKNINSNIHNIIYETGKCAVDSPNPYETSICALKGKSSDQQFHYITYMAKEIITKYILQNNINLSPKEVANVEKAAIFLYLEWIDTGLSKDHYRRMIPKIWDIIEKNNIPDNSPRTFSA